MYISGGGIKNDQKESDIIYAWSLTGVFLAPARKMFIFCLQFWIESKPYLPMCTVSTWHTFLMDGRTTVTFHPIFFGKPSKEQLALITCQEPFNAHWSKANRIKPSLGFSPRNYNIDNTYQSQAFDFFYENYKYLLCFQSFQR